MILKSSPWWYEDIEISNLSREKVILLIENNVINPTVKSFKLVKDNHEELVIKLIEKNKRKYIEIVSELILDSDDIYHILKSSVLNNSEKNKFLDICSENEITANIENMKLIIWILIANTSFTVTESLIKKILLNTSLPLKDRIILFNKKSTLFNNSETMDFLNSLSNEYSEINNTGRKAKIENNIQNQNLLNILKSKGLINSISETKYGLRVNHKRK